MCSSDLSYAYDCKCLGAGNPRGICYGGWETMTLTLAGTRATAKLASAAAPTAFTLDKTYRPRAGNASYLRYSSPASGGIQAALLVERELKSGGYALRTGGKGGYARYTVRGDAFDNQKFICRRK